PDAALRVLATHGALSAAADGSGRAESDRQRVAIRFVVRHESRAGAAWQAARRPKDPYLLRGAAADLCPGDGATARGLLSDRRGAAGRAVPRESGLTGDVDW